MMLQAQRIIKVPILDVDRLRAAALSTAPFEHVIVESFIHADWEEGLMADFPALQRPGSFPLSTVKFGSDFAQLIKQMNGAEFRNAVEEKFSISLAN